MQADSDPMWLTPERGEAMDTGVAEEVPAIAATSGNTYRWDPENLQYIYNWNTKGLVAGYWYKIFAKLDDGSTYSVTIGLR